MFVSRMYLFDGYVHPASHERVTHTQKKNVRQREGHVQYRIDKKNDVPTQIGIYTAEITAETIDDSSKSGTCVRVVILQMSKQLKMQ